MKRVMTLLLAALLLLGQAQALAQGAQQGFTAHQLAQLLPGKVTPVLRQVSALGDSLYALSEGGVLQWRVGDQRVSQLCALPQPPAESLIRGYDALSPQAKAQMEGLVTHLFAGEDALWGLNLYTGRAGKLSSQGVAWQDATLDTVGIWDKKSPMEEQNLQGFVQGGALYLLLEAEVVAWDMAAGQQRSIQLPMLISQMIAYRPGQAILMGPANRQDRQGGYSDQLMVLQLNSGQVAPLPMALVAFEGLNPTDYISIAGLAWDAESDSLYYRAACNSMAEHGMLCRATGDGPFEKLGIVPATFYSGCALPGGRYATLDENGQATVYEAAALANAQAVTLRIKGVYGEDGVIQRFMQLNPDLVIQSQNSNPDEKDITALITGEGDVDIYAIFANRFYRAAKEKGYAASLGDSQTLRDAVARLNPALHATLHNKQGQLCAYPPAFLVLGLCQVDTKLWQACFGEAPYPTTYAQMIDVMTRWQREHAKRHEDVNAYGPFDLFVLLWEMVYQYIAEYEQPGQPITFDGPLFREALSAFARLRDEIDMERFAKNSRDSGRGLFSGGGLIVDGNPLLFDTQGEGAGVIAPMGFEEGKPSHIQANVVVLMVNAHSQKQQQAIQFIEYLSQDQVTSPQLRYALQPSLQEPVESPYYLQKSAELTAQHDQLTAAAQSAEPLDRQAYLDAVQALQGEMARLEAQRRWLVSKAGIDRYQDWSKRLLFPGESLYISHNDTDNPFYKAVIDLSRQFTQGSIGEEVYIAQLNDISRKVYYESK